MATKEAGRIAPPDHQVMTQAADIIRRGGLVSIPTETVYGLAADATNGEAVARIYAAKDRPNFNPLISHISDLNMARRLAVFSPMAEQLAEAFWPGPLTLVLPKAERCPVSDLVTAGLGSIAVRMPDHPVALGLIRACECPLAAPSANPSETLSPTTAQHVADGLGNKVELILDGGPCRSGLESTVVSLAGDTPALLRPGALEREKLEEICGPLAAPGDEIASPGMLKKHYSPAASLRLNAERADPDEAYLAFGEVGFKHEANLSPSGDLIEAAANLFSMLRILDMRFDRIAIAPIPHEGLGEAINDRLTRAAVE